MPKGLKKRVLLLELSFSLNLGLDPQRGGATSNIWWPRPFVAAFVYLRGDDLNIMLAESFDE